MREVHLEWVLVLLRQQVVGQVVVLEVHPLGANQETYQEQLKNAKYIYCNTKYKTPFHITVYTLTTEIFLNPLRPNSDQHLIPPYNVPI